VHGLSSNGWKLSSLIESWGVLKHERILITGCGRSGTAYSASILSDLGLPTSHEGVFGLLPVAHGEAEWPLSRPSESSWLAVPFLGELPPGVAVLHQVREPLAVIRSFARIRLFEDRGPYWEFLAQHLDGLESLSPLEGVLRYWDEWNRETEQAAAEAGLPYLRYRLEDLDEALLGEILGFIGFDCDPERLRAALSARPKNVNTRGDKSRDGDITWESLPAGPALDAVYRRARTYGYDVPAGCGL